MDLRTVDGPVSTGEMIVGLVFVLVVLVGLLSCLARCLARRIDWRDAASWALGLAVAWPLAHVRSTEAVGLGVMLFLIGLMGAGIVLRFRGDQGLRRIGARVLESTAVFCTAGLIFSR
jgi:hypothetical protein